MPSHLSNIGFEAENRGDFNALVERAAASATEHACSLGSYLAWSAGGGPELWLQRDAAGALVGFNPHFAGQGRLRFGLVETIADAEHPFDGALFGWAAPTDERPSSGAYPLVIDLADFDRVRDSLVPGSTVELQVAAFAHELKLHASEDALAAAQGDGPKLAPEAFIPTGLFGADQPRRAEALFTGRILSGGLQTNAATGALYYALLVKTLGGTYDVVADPLLVAEPPRPGAIVEGQFWLGGRLVEP